MDRSYADLQAACRFISADCLTIHCAWIEFWNVRALAESLGEKKFTLVGHDWGGGVAWAFAAYYPEYLEKLVIINCPHFCGVRTGTEGKSRAAIR